MGLRLDLHDLLKTLTTHVYFQPPASFQMQYPCIVYRRDYSNVDFSDNVPYRRDTRYQVTVIDADPDGSIFDKVGNLPKSAYVRSFVADKLNHDVFSVYF